jgi:hypothetical protein
MRRADRHLGDIAEVSVNGETGGSRAVDGTTGDRPTAIIPPVALDRSVNSTVSAPPPNRAAGQIGSPLRPGVMRLSRD